MQWVIWDEEKNGPATVMNKLPPELDGKGVNELRTLGYRRLFTHKPEDFIPRFPALLGSSRFEIDSSGDVYQTYPDADYSVANVKKMLKDLAAADASMTLGSTDWYIIRKMETGAEIPSAILSLRKKIRDHVDWIRRDIEGRSARELVDYKWTYPANDDEVMVDGHRMSLTGKEHFEKPKAPISPELENLVTNGNLGIDIEIPTREDLGVDVNDTQPVNEDRFPYLTDPAPKGNATSLEDIIKYNNVPVIPEGDIRRMNEAERRKLPKEKREKLERAEIERVKKEKEEKNNDNKRNR